MSFLKEYIKLFNRHSISPKIKLLQKTRSWQEEKILIVGYFILDMVTTTVQSIFKGSYLEEITSQATSQRMNTVQVANLSVFIHTIISFTVATGRLPKAICTLIKWEFRFSFF